MVRHKQMMAVVLTVLVAWAWHLPTAAQAAVVAFNFAHHTSPTYDYTAIGTSGDTYDVGYEFSLTNSIDVIALGTFDYANSAVAASMTTSGVNPVAGLDVSIYTSTGTLLASATVVTGDTVIGVGADGRAGGTSNSSFVYHTLGAPVTLGPGNYVIISETRGGATNHSFSNVVAADQVGGGYYGSLITDPSLGLSYVGSLIRNSPSSISSDAFFTDSPTGYPGYFGPNFIIYTPEPASLSLLAVGGLMVFRRRKSDR